MISEPLREAWPLLLALIVLALIGLVVVLRLPVINGTRSRGKGKDQAVIEADTYGEEAEV